MTFLKIINFYITYIFKNSNNVIIWSYWKTIPEYDTSSLTFFDLEKFLTSDYGFETGGHKSAFKKAMKTSRLNKFLYSKYNSIFARRKIYLFIKNKRNGRL